MTQARRERSNAQVTVSIPWDLYRAIDRHREGTKLTRSKLVETAVREYLENADSAERERRDGLGEKIEEVLELVKHQADRISEEAQRNTQRQVGLLMRDRRATERVYALLESWVPEEYQQETYEGANEAAGKRLKREAERDQRRRAAEAEADQPGEDGDA